MLPDTLTSLEDQVSGEHPNKAIDKPENVLPTPPEDQSSDEGPSNSIAKTETTLTTASAPSEDLAYEECPPETRRISKPSCPPPLPPWTVQGHKSNHARGPPPIPGTIPIVNPEAERRKELAKMEYLRMMQEANEPGANGPHHVYPIFPHHMFFYGSLMDPRVLKVIALLREPPTLHPARIAGYSSKMWGVYPTLIPDPEGTVDGMVWMCKSKDEFMRLERYETSKYFWDECVAEMVDGEEPKQCITFRWAGDPTSKELEDGKFDLERFQKHIEALR